MDLPGIATLIASAVQRGTFKCSEWCIRAAKGPWAACDVYTITQFEWNPFAMKELPTRYYVKFAVSNTGQMLLTVSNHPEGNLKMKAELNRNGELCPACGEGRLTSRISANEVEHEGVREKIPMHYSECDYCGSELAGEAEAQENKRAMTAFKKKAEGLLTGPEIRKLRQRLDLTQTLAAKLFGGGKIAFSRYEHDDITQSASMDSLLRLCEENPDNLLILAKHKKVDLPPAFAKGKFELNNIREYWVTSVRIAKREQREARLGDYRRLSASNDNIFHQDSEPAEKFPFRQHQSCSPAH